MLPQVQIMALTSLCTILHNKVTRLKSIHTVHRTNKGLLCSSTQEATRVPLTFKDKKKS